MDKKKISSTGSITYNPSDWISSGILYNLLDGEKTTTQLRQVLGCDDTDSIRYRVREHMEPEGIVSISRGEPKHETQIPPLKIKLTTEGREWAESLDLEYDASKETVSSRLRWLENKVQTQDNKIENLELENKKLRQIVGIGVDQNLPNVVAVRAGYIGVNEVLTENILDDGMDDIWSIVPKLAADEYRQIKEKSE